MKFKVIQSTHDTRTHEIKTEEMGILLTTIHELATYMKKHGIWQVRWVEDSFHAFHYTGELIMPQRVITSDEQVKTGRAHIPSKCSHPAGLKCPICEWGAFICEACRCAEGELPTDCPGKPVPMDIRQNVMDGKIDYKDGAWVEKNGV